MKFLRPSALFLIVLCILSSTQAFADVNIQLIRNATLKIDYAGSIILVDPMLSSKGAFESFAGIEKNPTAELPLPINEIVGNVGFILLTHNHPDHWDTAAVESISKDIPIFIQKADMDTITASGFNSVIPVISSVEWQGITIQRTEGNHGSDEILKAVPLLGTVSGYILRSEGHPSLYIVGDTILDDAVRKSIIESNAEILILNSGGAKLPVTGFEDELILMDTEQVMEVAKIAPQARIVAVHMDALDHCTVNRNELRKAANRNGIGKERLIIPDDGEKVNLK